MSKLRAREDYTYAKEGNYAYFGEFEGGVQQGVGKGADWNTIARYVNPVETALYSGSSVYISDIFTTVEGVPVYLTDGSVGTPALSWQNDRDSALYRLGSQNFGWSVAATLKYDWNATRLKLASGFSLDITDMTSGSVLFAGTGGRVSQNNSAFFWDNTNLNALVTNSDSGVTYQNYIGIINETLGGITGIRLRRSATSASSHPIGFSLWSSTSVNSWAYAIDASTTDLVLAYDAQLPGDIIRLTQGEAKMEFGRSVASPSGNSARFQIDGSSSDSGFSTPVTSILQCHNNVTGVYDGIKLTKNADSARTWAAWTQGSVGWRAGFGASPYSWTLICGTSTPTPSSPGTTLLTVTTDGHLTGNISDAVTTPHLDLIQGSTGDAAIRVAIGSTTSWAFGADNSDSDKWKLCYAASGGAVLGTNDFFTMSSAGLATFAGQISSAAQAAGTPSIFHSGNSGVGIGFVSGQNWITSIIGSNIEELIYSGGMLLKSDYVLSWTDGAPNTGTADVNLLRDAAGVLALQRGTSSTEVRVYGTTTGPKYLRVVHDGSDGYLMTNSGGGSVILGTGGSSRWLISATATGSLCSAANYRFSHGTSALATNATEGFFHVQSCNGTPTGTPASIPTGQIPMVYDTSANKIWFYNGSWRGVVVT